MRRAVEASPNDASAQYNLATALSQQGRLEEAVPHYEKAVQLRRREPAYLIGLASASHRLGRVDSAAEVYRRVLVGFPVWPDIGRRYVEVAFDRRDLDPALAELETLMRATQYSGVERTKVVRTAAHGIISAYIDTGRQDEAIRRCTEVLGTLDNLPMDSGGYHIPIIIPLPGLIIYGTSYTEKSFIKAGSIHALFYDLRGKAKFRRGDYAAAAADFRESLGREPDGPGDLSLGRLLLETGRPGDAALHLQRFVDAHPSNFLGRTYYAVALKQTGQALNADRELERVHPARARRWIVTDLPSGYEAVEALALGDQTWGRTTESIANYKKVLALNPSVGAAYKRLGEIYRDLGEGELAHEMTRKAADLLPGDDDLRRRSDEASSR